MTMTGAMRNTSSKKVLKKTDLEMLGSKKWLKEL